MPVVSISVMHPAQSVPLLTKSHCMVISLPEPCFEVNRKPFSNHFRIWHCHSLHTPCPTPACRIQFKANGAVYEDMQFFLFQVKKLNRD